ncbi:MAG: hypothetical protein GYB31_08680 [Bacteroidetes bacterium]|nr:hypothetical protein [Bacteroidota bacterium]
MKNNSKKIAEISEENRPLVLLEFKSVKLTEEIFNQYVKSIESLWETDESYYLIMDIRELRIPKFKYLRMQAAWIKLREKELLTYCRGVSLVINRPLLWLTFRIVIFLQEPPFPYKVFRSLRKAIEYGENQLGLDSVQNASGKL